MATSVDEADAQSTAQIGEELERLIASHPPPEDFFRRFLEVAVGRLGASGGEAWGLSKQGLLALIGRVGEADASPGDAPGARRRLQRLLQILHSGQPGIHDEAQGGDHTNIAEQMSLLSPLVHGGNCIGVVEVFLPAGASVESAQSQLEVLCEMTGHASRYVASLHADEPATEQLEFLRRLEQFALRLHGQSTSQDVARTAATEARLLLGCDRVGVAVRQGKQAEMLAVSGQERIVRRSNLIRAMSRVASQVLASGRPIRYAGSLEGLPPQVETPLVEYLAESGARSLSCVALSQPKLPTGDDSAPAPQLAAIGVLLVEHLGDGGRAVFDRQVEQLAAHVSQALAGAREREGILLLPLRKALGSFFGWAAGDGRKISLMIAAVTMVLLAAFALVPAPYRVEAEGRLLPTIQRRVFAPQDGEVVEVYVRDGQRVDAHQPLLRLRNDELAIRILTARNELSEKRQLQAALEAQENAARRNASPAEQIRLRGRISQTSIEIESLHQHLAELAAQQEQLVVKADIAGAVATFQPQELLVGRPVERGQLLLEVMDPTGPWQLELEVPAHRLGRILEAQQRQGTDQLPVQFVLATAPERTCRGRMRRLATRAGTSDDGAATIEVVADVDSATLARPTVGAEVIARIDCGRTNLAYAVLGDLVEFVRLHVW